MGLDLVTMEMVTQAIYLINQEYCSVGLSRLNNTLPLSCAKSLMNKGEGSLAVDLTLHNVCVGVETTQHSSLL